MPGTVRTRWPRTAPASRPLALLTAAALLLSSAGCGGAGVAAGSGLVPTPEEAPMDSDFLALYAATYRFRLGQPTQITFTPDGEEVLFLRSGPRSFVQNLYALRLADGTERELLTAESLLGGEAEALSPEERARRERLRLAARGVTRFELSRDGARLLVPLSDQLYVVERATGVARALPSEGGFPDAARLSPDGTKVGCVRDGDLWVIDVESGTQRRLTDRGSDLVEHGLAEFVAQEEMRRLQGWWWSPDSSRILYQRTELAPVEELFIMDPTRPEDRPRAFRYPRAGTDNATVTLGVVPVEGGDTTWIAWDRDALPYLAAVRWSEGAPLTLVVQDRRQHETRLLAADVRTGATTTLHVETDDAWVNLDPTLPRWVDGGDAFLWSTERNGGWQLELRGRDGALIRTLTEVEDGYEALAGIDEARGVAWFTGGPEPTEVHVYEVPLAEERPPRQVTREPGEHEAVLGPEGRWVHGATLRDGRIVHRVHDGDRVAGELRSDGEPLPFAPRVEWVTVGERELRASVTRPRDFDPKKSYPVIVMVYGGPHARMVRGTARRYLLDQWFADQGFVVVSADGRGTPRRGRAWERAIRGDFIDVPMEDQVAALQALGERYDEMDLDRVGIFGWSFGGYFSSLAVMMRPDVFHVAVAGAPVADWHDYDTHYTERYLGLPSENPEGYRASSVLTHAPGLARPLLIVHGTADDNVYFMHGLKLSDALFRAGRPHTFLPLARQTHMVAEPDLVRALYARVLGFLRAHLGEPR